MGYKLAKIDPSESNKVFIGGVPAHTQPETGTCKVYVQGKPIILGAECTHGPKKKDNTARVYVGT
jgi:hypothetical protein